ncbi:hypothetical protein M422DRAFT_263854 [Sphaerobolus stellatus SS14]|uniref:Uncharacterized protein n=1 Tax=Sphaerobolus stellatus (strain SS14) TaxID=990650 RepID=A0A0C9UXP3_SPHS4|nr:hypothetical protein M422DRAFT_263854 [Sphaerobolus stellatus SS14]
MLRPTTESLSAPLTARSSGIGPSPTSPIRPPPPKAFPGESPSCSAIPSTVISSRAANSCMCSSPPHDYHRQHAPVFERVIEIKIIPGLCYLQVVVKPEPAVNNGSLKLGMQKRLQAPKDGSTECLEPPDQPGYQFLQACGLILIENPILGS